jgi:dienelactone hydrolase
MNHKRIARSKRFAVWLMASLLFIFVVVIVAIRLIFPQQEPIPTNGAYAVASILYTYTDENRIEQYSTKGTHRKVNVEFWYPENIEGVFPLVIFSHGALGIRSSNMTLYRELASHGYIVGALDHPYQAFWAKDDAGKFTFLSLDYLADLQQEDAKTNKDQSFVYYQGWMETRMGDINLVLDTILDHADSGKSGVYSLVDTSKVGVMGHSLGGSAALGIGRQRDDVHAIIALESPFLYDIVGVENDEFIFMESTYPTPVLNIYSDDSWAHLAEWAQYGKNYALLSDIETTVYNIHISGVGHLALTDLVRSSPFLVQLLDSTPTTRDSTEILSMINSLIVEFFNSFLKNQGEFSVNQADFDY